MAEADQRAAAALSPRMPGQSRLGVTAPRPKAPSPYEPIAADLRASIESGTLLPGDAIPTIEELAMRHGVSAGTAHRAVAVLKSHGLIATQRGRRAVVV